MKWSCNNTREIFLPFSPLPWPRGVSGIIDNMFPPAAGSHNTDHRHHTRPITCVTRCQYLDLGWRILIWKQILTYICLSFYHGLGINMIGSDLKAKREKHIIHGHETNWVYFERNVWISLSNDNMCLQITDREGLQNVTQHLRQRREQLSAQANTTCSCEILTNKHEIDAKSNISRSWVTGGPSSDRMPFPVHLVTPVRMSDTRIPPDTENKLESVTNTTLCQVRD